MPLFFFPVKLLSIRLVNCVPNGQQDANEWIKSTKQRSATPLIQLSSDQDIQIWLKGEQTTVVLKTTECSYIFTYIAVQCLHVN